MRRLLLLILLTLFGLGVGLAVGAIVMHRVDRAAARTAHRFSPEHLAEEVARSVAALRFRARAALEAGRVAAAEREAELRARYGLVTLADAAQRAGQSGNGS